MWRRRSPNGRCGARLARAGGICTAACSGAGVSFEWHDFKTHEEFDWGRSFHPGSVEVCLNLEGNGQVAFNNREAAFTPLTAGFYRRGEQPLRATRQAQPAASISHGRNVVRFFAAAFGRFRHVVASAGARRGCRAIRKIRRHAAIAVDEPAAAIARQPARSAGAGAGAIGLVSGQGAGSGGGIVSSSRRANRNYSASGNNGSSAERVEKVIALLREKLAKPPNLEEIGRAVGCSPFHLSRTFSTATGLTIPQYTRQLRMERAAELLRSGKFNVTRGGAGSGLFEPEPFQPGVSRDVRLLSRTLSAAHAHAKERAETEPGPVGAAYCKSNTGVIETSASKS